MIRGLVVTLGHISLMPRHKSVALIAESVESAHCCVHDADGLTVIIESTHCWFRFCFVLGFRFKVQIYYWKLSLIQLHPSMPIQADSLIQF